MKGNFSFWKTMGKSWLVFAVIAGSLAVSGTAYSWYFGNRILPRTSIGSVYLSGLTRDQAASRLQQVMDSLGQTDIRLNVDGITETIQTDAIGFDLNLSQAVDEAFSRGHNGTSLQQIADRISSLWKDNAIQAPVRYDDKSLRDQIGGVADATEIGKRDIRLAVRGGSAVLLTDTHAGRVLPREEVAQKIIGSLQRLDAAVIGVALVDDPPQADPQKAQDAVGQANKIMARPLTAVYEDMQFVISKDKIGSWLISTYTDGQLVPSVDQEKIAGYVTTIAKSLNVYAVPAQVITDGGRVTGFTPPKVGRVVEEDKLAQMISDTLMARASDSKQNDTLTIPMKTTNVQLDGLSSSAGITEVIGKATTPFTGSPKNRISNIKNGVKFLTGTVIQPGEEFSTLKTLGAVDNTTGYLPELVIKGDRTTPDFGGGLCQVSTTLFRAVLNAGLPVTARRNHSYRVSYYEKDGTGKFIGPGLDATIYEPDLDFKFRNDTATPILIIGYVVGDKISFELYGTKDGRTSQIVGPKLLTETPPGDAVDIPTDTLPVGMRKQVETPHPGGSAEAIYNVTYADGHTTTQDFKSYYRRWPAKFLVGTNTKCSTAAQCALISSALLPSPTPTP